MLDKWSLQQQWNQLHITDKEDEIGTTVRKEGLEAPQEVNCRTIIYLHNPILWVPPNRNFASLSWRHTHLFMLTEALHARIKTHKTQGVHLQMIR